MDPNKIDKETQEKIQMLQIYEQNFQSILMQKQTFQVELNETEKALEELKDSKDDVFKIIGNIIIKTNKQKLEEESKKKKELLSLRLKSIEKQEEELTKELEKIRQEVMAKLNVPEK